MKRNGIQSNLDSFFNVSKRMAGEHSRRENDGTNNVVSIEPVLPGTSEGRGTFRYRGIRSVRKIDETYHQSLVQELSEMANQLPRRLGNQGWNSTSRFFKDVIVYRNDEQRLGMEQLLTEAGSSYRGNLFFYVTDLEGNHIHFVHDCLYSNRSCRCAWRDQIMRRFPGAIKQTQREKREYISKFTIDDWLDVFIYYFLRKWGKPQKIWFNGENQRLPSPSESIRWEEMQRKSAEILAGDNGWFSDNIFEEGQENKGRSADITRSGWVGVRPKTTIFDTILETIQALLEQHPCTPLSAIKLHDKYRAHNFLKEEKNRKNIQNAIEDFGLRLNNFSLRDFYKFYTNEGCDPQFDPSKLYYDEDESLTIIDDLLKFQFNDDENEIARFLNSIVTVFDKKLPKLNTICVHGPHSAGKNFFFDMIFAIAANTGQFTISNSKNSFAFQEAPNKRLLIWNEPNYCSSYTDLLKLILGGDSYVVRVKNREDMPVQRTPVFVLTNNHVNFMHDKHFSERLEIFYWKQPSWLQNYIKKPYPMSFFKLLNKYNIEFYYYVLLSQI